MEKHPGLCYRELQSTLATANGTLRHHLDVLQSRQSITVMPVNGRTCYFAGAPTQVEVLKGISVNEQRAASALPIGLSLVQRLIIEDIVNEGIPRSQLILLDELVEHVRLFTLRSRSYDDEVFCVKTELT